MGDLEVVYVLRRRLNRLEQKLKSLTSENVQNNIETNRRTVARIHKIEAKIIKLKGIHNDKINQIYSTIGQRPKTASINKRNQMKISEIDIGDTITTLKMTPIYFKLDEKKNALENIVYPTDGTDRNLINTIARYRTIINKSKDFLHQPLEVNQNCTETVLIALDHFARQYGGELTFTNDDLSFSHSAEQTASGVVNLGCVHLIASNFIPTAKFSIKINLNYDRDLAQSISTMKNFIRDFHKELTRLLQCKGEFIRIFSIQKLDHKRGMIQIHFGLTTPDKNQTESLARHFQTLVRRSDFRNEKILRFIQSNSYRYELITLLSYLQLSSKDFHRDNNDHLPIGWFYHALNLSNKYPDDNLSLDRQNTDDKWLVAFHGTCPEAIDDDENINRIKAIDAGSALYVTTHCNGGVDNFTTPFTVLNGDQNETFRIVFQCRVKPHSFTIENNIVNVGEAWRIVDPEAVRPDGFLIKKEISLS